MQILVLQYPGKFDESGALRMNRARFVVTACA
jgi:hypothetical protein